MVFCEAMTLEAPNSFVDKGQTLSQRVATAAKNTLTYAGITLGFTLGGAIVADAAAERCHDALHAVANNQSVVNGNESQSTDAWLMMGGLAGFLTGAGVVMYRVETAACQELTAAE